jgi:DNA (cytosine-5)-methyltransferase 1
MKNGLATHDFFAGSGLVSTGLQEAGCSVVWANDICPKKSAVYRANHPDDPFLLGSIEHVTGSSIPAARISWASFPCQDLSLAGKRDGLAGERSGLFWQWLRVMDEMTIKPEVVALENVTGLLTSLGGADFQGIMRALSERGWHSGALMLNASHWIPQSRPRLFIIGCRNSQAVKAFSADGPDWHHTPKLREIASKLPEFIWWNFEFPTEIPQPLAGMIQRDAPPLGPVQTEKLLAEVPVNHRPVLDALLRNKRKVATAYRRTRNGKPVLELRFDGVAGCLRTAEGGSSRQYVLYERSGQIAVRLLTSREAARLMGAPETFVLPVNYNEAYNAMGDGVAVPVTRSLTEQLLVPLASHTHEKRYRRTTSGLLLSA